MKVPIHLINSWIVSLLHVLSGVLIMLECCSMDPQDSQNPLASSPDLSTLLYSH